jgi:hypothetical protein
MEEILEQAIKIYHAKIQTGRYDHYDAALLEILFADCLTQAVAMHHINAHRNETHAVTDSGPEGTENATYFGYHTT